MAWWVWTLISGAVAVLVVDWLIVMGADPRKWKGGERSENNHRK